MTAARRIGIFGGSFDPIHCGHVDVARAVEETLSPTRMFLVPAHVPPHRPQPVASSHHRFAMVAIAVAGHAGWRASDLELRTSAPSFTSSTLERFHERGYSSSELFFVIGADAFAEIGSWKDYPGILDRAHFAVVSRPGFPATHLRAQLPHLAARMVSEPPRQLSQVDPLIILIDGATADVSSTAIRQRRADGLSIGGLVDVAVQQHIEQHGLYSSTSPGLRASDKALAQPAGRLHGQS
jgi:nicotinate-nucleotide adenylyltransferase